MRSLDIRRRPQSPRLALLAGAALTVGPAALAADPATVARRVVADRVGVAVDETRVWSVTPRTFADASLGCPEPGMAYPQVLTPGHVVLVEADGRRFDIRVSGDRGRICYPGKAGTSRPAGEPAAGPAALPTDTTPAARARRDLAGLLGLAVDDVTLIESHPRGPREALAGCGAAPAGAGETVLTLLADGRTYQYLASGNSVRPCPAAANR